MEHIDFLQQHSNLVKSLSENGFVTIDMLIPDNMTKDVFIYSLNIIQSANIIKPSFARYKDGLCPYETLQSYSLDELKNCLIVCNFLELNKHEEMYRCATECTPNRTNLTVTMQEIYERIVKWHYHNSLDMYVHKFDYFVRGQLHWFTSSAICWTIINEAAGMKYVLEEQLKQNFLQDAILPLAVLINSTEIVEYVYKHGKFDPKKLIYPPIDSRFRQRYLYAATGQHLDIVKYMLKKETELCGGILGPDTLGICADMLPIIAKTGNIKFLKFIHENGYRFDYEDMDLVRCNGHNDCLDYMCEQSGTNM